MAQIQGWKGALVALGLLAPLYASLGATHSKRYIVKRLGAANERVGVMNARTEGVFAREVVRVESEAELLSLRSQVDVVSVEEDFLMKTAQTPSDPLYFSQWHYHDSLGGINLPSAWNLTTGSSEVVVAVLDTGITNHPDLAGRLLPGADLISDPLFANDGDGRDSNPSDPGDWVNPGDPCYQGSAVSSSWHGTHVAGTIAANKGNSLEGVGVNWASKILPVRVLGKCGGYTSDIADGIRWAVGGRVAGLGVNPNPARVINMSLGGEGPCTSDMQGAIDYARSKKAVVVVAAGNSTSNLDYVNFAPANCRGVIVVGANNRNGGRAYYSNYGEMIDLIAPGGDSMGAVVSLTNYGSTSPIESAYGARGMTGTSMATPHVAGVVSLMLSVNLDLYPDQVAVILKETARSFGHSSLCDERICGAGIIDAYEAVYEAARAVGDADISDREPVRAGPGEDGQQMMKHQSSDGGFCGSVDFKGGPGGGSGMLMLTLGAMMAALASRRSREIAALPKGAPVNL